MGRMMQALQIPEFQVIVFILAPIGFSILGFIAWKNRRREPPHNQ